jgi:hypothetical protein
VSLLLEDRIRGTEAAGARHRTRGAELEHSGGGATVDLVEILGGAHEAGAARDARHVPLAQVVKQSLSAARLEHRVEDRTLGRTGDQAPVARVPARALAAPPGLGQRERAAVDPEALLPEAVRDAALGELGEPRLELARRLGSRELEREPVPAQVADPQLVPVPLDPQHLQAAVVLGGVEPLERTLRSPVDAEPLARDRVTILASRIADVPHRYAAGPGQRASHRVGGQPLLLDLDVQVLAAAARRVGG